MRKEAIFRTYVWTELLLLLPPIRPLPYTDMTEDGVMTVKGSTETVKVEALEKLIPSPLDSELSIDLLSQMRYMRINSPSGADLLLFVEGVARVPRLNSLHGTVVHVITATGTITLDGKTLAFNEDVAPVFAEAGFAVAADGRRLLGL